MSFFFFEEKERRKGEGRSWATVEQRARNELADVPVLLIKEQIVDAPILQRAFFACTGKQLTDVLVPLVTKEKLRIRQCNDGTTGCVEVAEVSFCPFSEGTLQTVSCSCRNEQVRGMCTSCSDRPGIAKGILEGIMDTPQECIGGRMRSGSWMWPCHSS